MRSPSVIIPYPVMMKDEKKYAEKYEKKYANISIAHHGNMDSPTILQSWCN